MLTSKASKDRRTSRRDFLKTSTGFGPGGATVGEVRLLARFGKVKASGGIRTREQALALVAAGASRLGTSRTAEILCTS